MALPHPHGDASGEIAHLAVKDTGVTPGSTGGKFIGFGEEGTSAVGNRAHWALSQNVDYVYQILASDIAVPAGASWIVPGGGASTFQFTGDVWVGDAGYPTLENEGLLVLFAVLDDQYNELTDGADNEVRVAIVRDTTNVSNAYKNEFETDAVITFKTVDPVTGLDVVNPYTIPATTNVRLLYAEKGNFENLPTDAFVKFKVHSGAEVEAGVFLQDGTREMTGHADWDSHRLDNVLEMRGVSGADLTLRAVLDDIWLVADGGKIVFRDQNTNPGGVDCTEPDIGEYIEGYHDSVLGSLNSRQRQTAAFMGNRSLDRTGVLTFTDGTNTISWPTLNMVIDGEARVIAASSKVITTGSEFMLVLDSSGVIQERAAYGADTTDIPLAVYNHNGAAFIRKIDVRWRYNATSRTVHVSCGTGAGADFGFMELQEAVHLCCRLGQAQVGHPVLDIIGDAYAPPGKPEVDIDYPMTIQGGGAPTPGETRGSIIRSDEDNGDVNVLFDCNQHKVHFKDITLMHAGDTQAAGLSAIRNAGSGSTFYNVVFDRDQGTYDKGFASAFSWSVAARNIHIQKCSGFELSHSFVLGSNVAYTTAYMTESVVEDCLLSNWGTTATAGVVCNGDGNIVRNCEMPSGLQDYGIVAGNDTLVDRCKIRMTGAGGAAPAGILYKPLAAGVYHQSAVIRDSYFLRCDDGIQCTDITGLTGRVIVRGCYFHQTDRPFNFTAIGTPTGGQVSISECFTSSSNEYVAFLSGAMRYTFANNVCVGVGGACVVTGLASTVKITNNDIEGYGNAGAYDNAIKVGYLGNSIHITNNRFRDVGAPANSTMIELDWPATIANNHIASAGNADYGIRTVPSGIPLVPTSIENRIVGNSLTGMADAAIRIAGGLFYYYNGTLVADNKIFSMAAGTIGVEVEDAEGVVIDGNTFGGDIIGNIYNGRGIYVHGAGSANVQICNNHMKGVKGAAGAAGSPRVIEVTSAENIMISNNHIHECGTSNPAHWLVGNNQALIWVHACANYQIIGNHISQMTGKSAAADTDDTFYCIRVGGAAEYLGMVSNNYFYHNFAVAGYVAEHFYGIYCTANDVQIVGNRFHWTGTQGDVNKSGDVVCIECQAYDRMVVNSNVCTGNWQATGLTQLTSRFISIDGDYCVCVGNSTTGSGAGIHSIWFGSAASGVGVGIGNVCSGTETITWNLSVTNLPNAAQYGNMNQGAVSHG